MRGFCARRGCSRHTFGGAYWSRPSPAQRPGEVLFRAALAVLRIREEALLQTQSITDAYVLTAFPARCIEADRIFLKVELCSL